MESPPNPSYLHGGPQPADDIQHLSREASMESLGQAWRLLVHPQESSKAAYVNRKGEVKWNLQEIEVPTVEHCVRAVNDLWLFLPIGLQS